MSFGTIGIYSLEIIIDPYINFIIEYFIASKLFHPDWICNQPSGWLL